MRNHGKVKGKIKNGKINQWRKRDEEKGLRS